MGSKDKTTSQTNDPYKDMPDWLKDSLKGRTASGDALWDAAQGIDPTKYLDMNNIETNAFKDFKQSANKQGQRSDDAYRGMKNLDGGDPLAMWNKGSKGFGDRVDDLGGFEHGYQPGNFDSGYKGAGKNTYDGGYEAGTFDAGFDPTAGAYTGDRMTELLGNKDFGLDYTDNVVDTTMAGMNRQAQRDTLMRQSQQAATGGTSSTRSAVEDAVAGNLHNMSVAEMEAGLRDNAQRFETDSLFKQADALDSSDRFKSQDQRDAERMRTETRLKEMGMDDDSARFFSEQQMKEAELGQGDKRFQAELALKEQGMSDEAARALAGLDLNTQELEEMSKQFGLNFDKDTLKTGTDLSKWGNEFDMSKFGNMNEMANSNTKRDMAIFDIMKGFGSEKRGIDQAQQGSAKEHMGWLANMLSGTNLGGSMPTGSTTSSTQPGNSALQNVLGIGTGLAGAWMSDERTKEDISDPDGSALDKLAKLDDGLKEYKYKDGYGHTTKRTSGLMAQDLEKTGIKGAVFDVDGIKHVDAYPILATVVQAVNELREERT